MKKRIITLLAIVALLVVCAAFATMADGTFDETQLCPCGCEKSLATLLTTGNNNGTFSYVAAGMGSGHYVNTSSIGPGSTCKVAADAEVVIYLKNMTFGKTSFATTRNVHTIEVMEGAKVYIIGNNATLSTGLWTNSSGTKTDGAALYIHEGAEVWLSGDLTVRVGASVSGNGKADLGALIYNEGTLHMDGITLNATRSDGALAANKGGAIYNLGTAEVSNCEITGSANYGGAIYNDADASITVEDTTISDCTCYMGGAVYDNGGTTTLDTVTITNCDAESQTSGDSARGGGLYLNQGTVNMIDGSISGCTAANNGGAVFLSGSDSRFNMTGTAAITASAESTGNSDGVRLQGGAMVMLDDAQVISSGVGVGSGIYALNATSGGICTVTLDDNATVLGPNGEKENNIRMQRYTADGTTQNAILQVAHSWIGEASVQYANNGTSAVVQTPGGTSWGNYAKQVKWDETTETYVDETLETSFEGELWAESPDTDNPRINGWKALMMPRRVQVIKADGKREWHTDYPGAVSEAASSSGAYMKVWAVNRNITIPAGKTVYVDFNGKTLQSSYKLTVNGTLYAFDSKATAPNAGVAISPVVGTNGTVKSATVFGGNAYVVKDNVIYPVTATAKVTGATLRPAVAGIYFTAESTIVANDAVKAYAEGLFSTGVAVSLAPIDSLDNTAWTATAGTIGNGILVQNILIEDGGADRSEKPIYAEACVTYEGQLIALSDDDRSLSLTGLMTALNNGFDGLNETEQGYLVEFYNKWTAKFAELWTDLTNIVA